MCTDFRTCTSVRDYGESLLPVLLTSGWSIFGQLGRVLIPIRPGDERDVRPIRHPAAQQLVYYTSIKSVLMQPAYGLHESVTRWHDLASFHITNNKLLNPSCDISRDKDFVCGWLSRNRSKRRSAFIFMMHGKRNQTNEQHQVEVYFGVNCGVVNTLQSDQFARSMRKERIDFLSSVRRDGPSLNAASDETLVYPDFSDSYQQEVFMSFCKFM